jgi:hypothetical protein
MEIKARSLIDKINQTFIARTATAIHHCFSAWNTGKFGVQPEFGSEGGAQRKCDPRQISHGVYNACRDVFRCLDADFRSSPPEVEAKRIGNIRSMLRWSIHWTGTDSAMEQLHNNQGSCDEDCLDYVPE